MSLYRIVSQALRSLGRGRRQVVNLRALGRCGGQGGGSGRRFGRRLRRFDPALHLDQPLSELIPALLGQAAAAAETQVPAVIRLLIAESRAFPDLAKVWHDEVIGKILHLVTSAIKRAQARGE